MAEHHEFVGTVHRISLICSSCSHPHDCFPGSVEDGLLTAASSPACPPVGVGLVIQEVVDVTLLLTVEEAVVTSLLRAVVAVVAASLISLTSLVTLSQAGDGDQVVDCPARTSPLLLMGERVRGYIEDD